MSKELQLIGFEINPYEHFVANKMFHRKEINTMWHAEDLKLPHMNKREVAKVVKWLEELYSDMRVTRGEKLLSRKG